MNLDADKLLPLVSSNDPSGFVRVVHQRNADHSRMMPLIEALQQIVDWAEYPFRDYAERYGLNISEVCTWLTPNEIARAALAKLESKP